VTQAEFTRFSLWHVVCILGRQANTEGKAMNELTRIRQEVERALADLERIMQALLRVRALVVTECYEAIGGRV